MDSTTSALIAGAGLAVAVLALLAAFWVARSTQRRTDRQVLLLEQAQAALETRLQDRSVPPEPSSAVRSVVRVEDDGQVVDAEIVDAELVDDDDASAHRPGAALAPRRIDGKLFADLVAREALVKGASLAHGLKHALSGQTRNRIRHEMKREVKRSRKDRKDEVRIAVREYRARQRARVADESGNGENVA